MNGTDKSGQAVESHNQKPLMEQQQKISPVLNDFIGNAPSGRAGAQSPQCKGSKTKSRSNAKQSQTNFYSKSPGIERNF